METTKMTTFKDVLEYWRNQPGKLGDGIYPWKPFLLDPGEVCCWVCGRYFGEALPMDGKQTREDYVKSFEDSELKIHHIIPLGMGGEDTPENCCLLCPDCVENESIFLNFWKKRGYVEISRKLESARRKKKKQDHRITRRTRIGLPHKGTKHALS
jgi:hypothetical protein